MSNCFCNDCNLWLTGSTSGVLPSRSGDCFFSSENRTVYFHLFKKIAVNDYGTIFSCDVVRCDGSG